MKLNKPFLGTILLMVLVLGLMSYPTQASVTYTEAQGKITIETDNIWAEVTGNNNVPAYFFRGQTDSNDTRHRAQFVELFEFEDNNNNSKYDKDDTRVSSTVVALASLDVALSAVAETSGASAGISFNMSLTAAALVNLQFTEVTFENHITEENETRLKFDVIIDNYSFSLNGDMLALAFKLTSNVSNSTQFQRNDKASHVQFGQNAYLESNTYADVGGNQVNVSMSVNETADGSVMTYFSYPKFSGQLVHDPALGVESASDGSDTNGEGNDLSDIVETSWHPVLGMLALGLIPFIRFNNN